MSGSSLPHQEPTSATSCVSAGRPPNAAGSGVMEKLLSTSGPGRVERVGRSY